VASWILDLTFKVRRSKERIILALAPLGTGDSTFHFYPLGCQFETRCGRVLKGHTVRGMAGQECGFPYECRPGGMAPHVCPNLTQVLRRQTHTHTHRGLWQNRHVVLVWQGAWHLFLLWPITASCFLD